MSRRKALLAALALCGGVAVSVTPLASAAPTTPVQCPPHQLITQSDGNFFLWLPNPTRSPSCWITVEIPGSIQNPPASTGAAAAIPPPQPCGTHVLITQSDGNYYLWLRDPTGQTCWMSVEIPGNIQQPPPLVAASTSTTYPPPCPTHTLVTDTGGSIIVTVPNPGGNPCFIQVTIPLTIVQAPSGATEPPIDGCPAEPLAYENDGHDYVRTPDPSGQQTCGHYTELPVTVPPTL